MGLVMVVTVMCEENVQVIMRVPIIVLLSAVGVIVFGRNLAAFFTGALGPCFDVSSVVSNEDERTDVCLRV